MGGILTSKKQQQSYSWGPCLQGDETAPLVGGILRKRHIDGSEFAQGLCFLFRLSFFFLCYEMWIDELIELWKEQAEVDG